MKIRDSFISFSPPCIGHEEIQNVVETLKTDWISRGPKTETFEKDFARVVGAPAALAVNSCTAALHTSLIAKGIGPGDEVITTVNTFAATVNVIEHVGATPVLVDIELETQNFSIEAVASAITTKTKAILGVHFSGHPFDVGAISEMARSSDLEFIQDAAHALGASFHEKPIGFGNHPCAFSFYATKNITTGEGGMLTGSESFIQAARKISLHGMTRDAWKRYDKGGSWKYDVEAPGFKYNMSDIQASLGIEQLKKLPAFQRRRIEIAKKYSAAFENEMALTLPTSLPNVEHAWHLYVLRLNLDRLTIDRDAFIASLHERKVGASVHFIPIHLLSYYKNKYRFSENQFPVAFQNFQRVLSIPLNPKMSDEEVDYVIQAVLDVTSAHKS